MIGILVRDAILLQRSQRCEHVWVRLNETEEQCEKCTVIATEEGKKRLEGRKS